MTVTVAAPAATSAYELLRRCEEGIRVAERASDPGERFCAAHMAAIRAAAAVLAVRGRPRRGSGALNVWQVLPKVAPELGEWAAFFNAGATRRAAVQAGLCGVVSGRDADDLLRQTVVFANLVTEYLGLLPIARGA
jgi:hypothetical protein